MGLSNIEPFNAENIDTNSNNSDLFSHCHSESVYLAIKGKKLADEEISASVASVKVPGIDDISSYNSDHGKKTNSDNVTKYLPRSYRSIKKRYICINVIDGIDFQLGGVKIIVSLNKLIDIYDRQIKFLLFSLSFIIMSLVGIIIYYRNGYYIIHPTIYLLTLLMGLGWTCTAIGSILNNKGVKACIKKS